MVIPEKTYTNNPFVDNVIYYAKLLAMNCTVKDEDEAIANETKETSHAGDVLIACVEKTARYELFKSIPKEILEKYITVQSNLDLYVANPTTLKIHFNHYNVHQRARLQRAIDAKARETYMYHYNVMMNYLDSVSEAWLDDNLEIYEACVDGTATYVDLFPILPYYTKTRIIQTYLNNYDASNIYELGKNLSTFQEYIATRTDVQIDTELENISSAMRNVFIDHYCIMRDRGYFQTSNSKMETYVNNIDIYKKCKNGRTVKYTTLYDLFPADELRNCLVTVFGETLVQNNNLAAGCSYLTYFLENISSNPTVDEENITSVLKDKYLENFNAYLNKDIYDKCESRKYGYFDLIDYIPKETKKMILNAFIEEVTNIEIYASNKLMLDSYLGTLSAAEANTIKSAITKEMIEWYPSHHQEYNNYYRAFAGLPPVDDKNNIYEDTLVHSYNPETHSYIEFGNRFISRLPTGIYPPIHWKQQLWEFDSYDIGILNNYGILDEYIEACGATVSDLRYRYIRYLADNKLDIYQCRRAMQFQLIGLPTVDDEEAQKRFVDVYAINRDYVIRTVYTDAYKFQSDYYNKFIIIFIIVNTIMDMLSDITQMIIDREVFDARCIKWLFESFGVPYYSEIPVRYLRRMLKNLNMLLKYKSSTKNMIDICKLFGFNDVRVFGYYLFKDMNVDPNTGEFIMPEDNDINYDIHDLWVRDGIGKTMDLGYLGIVPDDGIIPSSAEQAVENKTLEEIDETNTIIKGILTSDLSDTVTDIDGIRYTRLDKYDRYDEEKFTKLIYYKDDDGNIQSKRIINKDLELYLYDPEAGFIPIKDSTYFTSIKADLSPAELKFIKVPIDDYLTEYKNDDEYLVPYDEVVYEDEGDTWHGGLDHDYLYNKLLAHPFNAVKSKYISIETVTDLTEQAFQMSYFYSMIFDNMYSEEGLSIKVPYIDRNHEFRFTDLICYLFAMMYYYNGLKDNIMYSPTQILYVKGYNFDEALNQMLDIDTAFTQEEDIGERENIFDINERIAEDGYDYQKAFKGYDIKSFNLSADIDALDEWLQENAQISLDDIIVEGTDITFRQFYSLNNSYYQKDIFQDAIAALPYNQIIKTAYGIELYLKDYENDVDGFEHEYVYENGSWMEVINSTDDAIFVMDYYTYVIDYSTYIRFSDDSSHAILKQYTKDSDGNYIKSDYRYYYYKDGEVVRLFDGDIMIVDNQGRYIFSANAYYTRDPVTGVYSEITDDKYFTIDANDSSKRCLVFGDWWVFDSNLGIWILDTDKTYLYVEYGGNGYYLPYSEVTTHEEFTVNEDECWIKHSDGHFVQFIDTDYYTKHAADGENISITYFEEDTYVRVYYPTDEVDVSPEGEIRYFRKLKDIYNENKWNIRDTLYVYDANTDSYIPEDELLSPNNCYFMNSNGNYELVVNNFARYYNYTNPRDISYILVLQSDNDYSRLRLIGEDYILSNDPDKRYVYNSNTDYITVLLDTLTYADTQSLVVIFNKAVTSSTQNFITSDRYNPEVTDNKWNENDWLYKYENDDMGDDFYSGLYGENIWYYRKPGESGDISSDAELIPVGSGFYMESSAYIGNVTLEEGCKYYMSFYVETNFTGKMQIYNTADSSVNMITDRVYEFSKEEQFYVTQVFVANNVSTPEIRLLVYDFDNFPITPGDFVIISKIKFVKAYSDNFIAQDIPSYDKLLQLYKTNTAIYKQLLTLMANESNYRKYQIYKKLYDALMISEYNKEAFKIGENTYARTYTEFLENRDAVLYSRLYRYANLDEDAMRKEIADEIVEITYALDSYIDTYSYGFLYSYFPAVSASYIQQYITKLINWFKSWKVHLLGINTVYSLGDPSENTVKALEDDAPKSRYDFIKGNAYVHDTIKINPLDDTNISGARYIDLYDIDDPTQTYSDEYTPKDRVRLIASTGDAIEFYDNVTLMHMVFNSDEIKVTTDDNILNISSSYTGFSVADENELIESSDNTDQTVFVSQTIAEINRLSGDYTEWSDLLNE